jgi:drug/metabolite transporter (DMT)-like permease
MRRVDTTRRIFLPVTERDRGIAGEEPQRDPGAPVPPGFVLALAVLGISWGGPLVRLSAAGAVVIALWRLGLTLLLVAVALALTGQWREWRRLRRTDALLSVLAGVALAAHFWTWTASVHLTTIAASVTLVSMQPVFVLAISAVYLHERPTGRQTLGIVVALAGALLITLPEFLGGAAAGAGASNPAAGNALALSGAVLAALYYVLGRRVRKTLGIWSYAGIAYTACFATLLLAAFLTSAPVWPQPAQELLIFAGLAIGPMLLGHTGMNWALRYRPAYVVNLTVLAEPFGASLIAALLPWIAEIPPLTTIAGGVVVVTGMFLAAPRSQ